MARAYRVLSVSLAADHSITPQTFDGLSYKYAYVLDAPAGAAYALVLDGGDRLTAPPGRGFMACGGGLFRSLAVYAPASGGILTVLLSNEELVPFGSAGPANGDVTLRRTLEGWWLPHAPHAAGDPFDLAALPAGFPMWSVSNVGGAGNPPALTVRGMRCALALTGAGGTSGYIGGVSFPWQRLRAEGGAGGATLLSPVGARVKAHNVAMLLRCDGQGNSHGGGGEGTGLQLVQGDGTQRNLSGNVAGMGIVRDNVAGAGAWWRFVARAADGLGLSIDAALPAPAGADVRKWTRYRVELVDADPAAGRDGLVNVYQDDSLVLGYTDMTKFPPSSDGALRTGLDFQAVGQSQQADALTWCRAHVFEDSTFGAAA